MSEDKVFEEAFEALMEDEGGWVNDPDDSGGETCYGISKSQYPHLDLKHLTIEDAKGIYYRDYWKATKYDKLAKHVPSIAKKLFNLGVNCGSGMANIFLQRACRAHGASDLDEDGIIGEITLGYVLSLQHKLLPTIRSEAAGYYRRIATKGKNKKYINGWLKRSYK